MLNFAASTVRYEPYPLLVLRPALATATYAELCANYPDASLFGVNPKFDYKLALSEKFAPENYASFIAGNTPWRKLHGWLKSDDFIRQTLAFLKSNSIDLDVDDHVIGETPPLGRSLRKIGLRGAPRLRSRFEFSVLKADGGEVAPHTDTPKKIVTLVQTMIGENEWDQKMGGGLDVNRPTDPAFAFNWANRMVPWEKIETIETIPFVANQCTIFVKTFNSLHSVRKMTQKGSTKLRKTVTIVIEKED